MPTGPWPGVKPLMAGCTRKAAGLVAVPPGVVTVMVPVVALAGTVVLMVLPSVTLKAALTPLNLTAVAPLRLVPLMVTLVPTGPEAGLKPVILEEDEGPAKAPTPSGVPSPVGPS